MKREKCPKCSEPFDPRKDTVIECPRCHKEGSTACCNMGGRNCLCNECENSEGGEDE
jgi:hypothetical protein